MGLNFIIYLFCLHADRMLNHFPSVTLTFAYDMAGNHLAAVIDAVQ